MTVCLHLKIEFRSCARGRQWCGIFPLPPMNSFNKTEAAVFSFRLCFLRASLSSVYYKKLTICKDERCVNNLIPLKLILSPRKNTINVHRYQQEDTHAHILFSFSMFILIRPNINYCLLPLQRPTRLNCRDSNIILLFSKQYYIVFVPGIRFKNTYKLITKQQLSRRLAIKNKTAMRC